MANDDIKYTLNVQTVDNPLTEDPKDTRFVLVSNGTADFDRVVSEIMALNPGLERETVEAVIRFEHRVIKRLTLNGMRVSNGLFSAVASPKGRGGSAWDPAVNTLDITIALITLKERNHHIDLYDIGVGADRRYVQSP